jgi:hypothetical protein
MFPLFAANAANEPKLEPKLDPNVEYVKNNYEANELLYEQVKKEEEKIMKNRVLLHNLEVDLSNFMERGLVEKEKCIRQSISALRTINYVYNWMLNQIDSMNYDDIRLRTIENIDRIKYLNKLFMDINYRINDCYLVNINTGITGTNEVTKYAVDNRSEIIRRSLSVPEDFQAARSPFR